MKPEGGALLGPKTLKVLQRMVSEFVRRERNERGAKGRWQQVQASYYGKLDGDLAAAVAGDYLTASAPTATVSVYQSDGAGGIEDAGHNVTVVNRFGIEYTSGTFGIIQRIAGEWVWMGDCAPLS